MVALRPAALPLALALWAFLFVAPPAGSAADLILPAGLIEQGGFLVTRDGEVRAGLNADQPFLPASTIKIGTALTALQVLGPDHRIRTEFYLRDRTVLAVKGYGDPYLVSERLDEIAATLKDKGLTRVTAMVLDDTFFALEGPVDGTEHSANPYDALNSALAVNFNTMPLIKRENGAIAAAEPQTPVLPLTREIAAGLGPGLHRVNVSAFAYRGGESAPQRYFAELFGELLRRRGIEVAPGFRPGPIEPGDRLIHVYRSEKTVAEMVRGCLHHSSNFIANQLFLCSGAARSGAPATWEKGRRAVSDILQSRAGLEGGQFTVVEGSGLSRKNRITPAAMAALLEAFKPHAHLLSRTDGILLKSGTMSGVYAYAGYFENGADLDPFVVLLNQPGNGRRQLLHVLAEFYRREL